MTGLVRLLRSYTDTHNILVIAPDLPGMGQYTLSKSGNYSSAAAEVLVALLDFLKAERVALFGYDKGASVGSVLDGSMPTVLPRWLSENPSRTTYGHWHLALFTAPEAAEFLIYGREKGFLNWGEASLVTQEISQSLWGPTAISVNTEYVPKSGHWLADENPTWLASFTHRNIDSSIGPSAINLGYLDDLVTMM
ncbi:hypothetical protein FBEOM_9276 [Fusarium beomiforme]|uniref:Uncharacterized protein n=1 Tax=Fusarium beomiforme TaxID=44412 RepID=A0A9P5ADL5_9HYPO|nr:hypothetical protein FBEOM_9276 [Fusarium beomiforme]